LLVRRGFLKLGAIEYRGALRAVWTRPMLAFTCFQFPSPACRRTLTSEADFVFEPRKGLNDSQAECWAGPCRIAVNHERQVR
jgi:hypothetical protein